MPGDCEHIPDPRQSFLLLFFPENIQLQELAAPWHNTAHHIHYEFTVNRTRTP
jgi:hypothetical protein